MSAFDPPLSTQALTDLLIKHGIVCRNENERKLLELRISTIGYYRLEEYSWSFRKQVQQNKSKRTAYFKQSMGFAPIWNTYLFDRRLRILLMDAIERLEIALRCALTKVLTEATGNNTPHADTQLFPSMQTVDKRTGKTRLQKWLANIQAKYDDSGTYDPRIEHCKKAHGITKVEDLPLWIVMELTTLGNLKTLYENMRPDLRTTLAAHLGVDESFLTSSLMLLHQVRNRCAHHKRVWNYLWLKKNRRAPLFAAPLTESVWNMRYNASRCEWLTDSQPRPSFNSRDTVFVFMLCAYWLDKLAQTSHWKERVENTVQPDGLQIKAAKEAGFVTGWNQHPIWR